MGIGSLQDAWRSTEPGFTMEPFVERCMGIAVTLTEPFDALPRSAQYLHVAALAFVAAAVVSS